MHRMDIVLTFIGRASSNAGNCGKYIAHRYSGLFKKNEIKPWLQKAWCIPEPSAEFVERMEDVLDVYKRPYDEQYPVVCLDETTQQLIGETKTPIPAQKGKPLQYDYEYIRNGVAHIFMMLEPLTGLRFVRVAQSHTRLEFAYCLQELAERYANAAKIILVMDNLNTHTLASLYVAFPPEQARAIAERFEIHYTPKHGSWLNMAEIGISVMNRQCLKRRIPDMKTMAAQIHAWVDARNEQKQGILWQFSTQDARIKLRRLYPKI